MTELKEAASYSVGMSIGQSLKEQNLDNLDMKSFTEGIQAIFNDEKTKFTPEEANSKIGAYLNAINASKFEKNKTEGEQFLANNAKSDDVVTLPSGLQYKIVENGTGAKPTATSQVSVHYHGSLINGMVFDSSIERGTPASFGVNQVIKGWTEALQFMPAGSKWTLYIPHDLAYGATPQPGGPIEPYATLIFDVELIDILS